MEDESYHSPWWAAVQKLLLIEAGLISFTGILYLLSDISFSSLLLGLGCVLIVVAAYMAAGSAKQGYPHVQRIVEPTAGHFHNEGAALASQVALVGIIAIITGILIHNLLGG